eukprot:77445_1
MATPHLSVIDTIIVAVYITAIFCVGMYAWCQQRKHSTKQAESYFLASRDVLWPAVGATLFSSNIGAEHFVGLSGSAAKSGIAVGAWEWTAPILLLIQGYFVAPIYISSKCVTTPEYLEYRFNRIVRVYNAFITLVIYIFVVISSTLYAGSVILNTVIGWGLYSSSIALIFATGIYVVLGGLRAVVYTENVQTIILIIGGLLLMGYSLNAVGGMQGMYDKYQSYPEEYRSEYMHIFRPLDDEEWPWLGVTFGIIVQSYYYWNGNHLIIQRVLSSKSSLHAKYGAIMASALKILPVWIMCIPGICAVLLYPEEFTNHKSTEYDRAYPMLVLRILPQGLVGLVVAAMLSALMSSLAAVYNSAATIITNDIVKLILKDRRISDTKLVFIGRVSACVFVCISLLWLPMIQKGQKELFAYTQAVSAYIQNPLSVIYFFGHFWDRANIYGAYACIITGFIVGFVRFIMYFFVTDYCNHTVFCSMNFLYFGMLMWLLCAVLLVMVSLLTAKPTNQQINGLTYHSRQRKDDGDIKHNVELALEQKMRQDRSHPAIEMQPSPKQSKSGSNDKGFVEFVDDGNSGKDNKKDSDSPRDIVVVHHGCCYKFLYLVGDVNNDNWIYLANIFCVLSSIGLLACWIAFF